MFLIPWSFLLQAAFGAPIGGVLFAMEVRFHGSWCAANPALHFFIGMFLNIHMQAHFSHVSTKLKMHAFKSHFRRACSNNFLAVVWLGLLSAILQKQNLDFEFKPVLEWSMPPFALPLDTQMNACAFCIRTQAHTGGGGWCGAASSAQQWLCILSTSSGQASECCIKYCYIDAHCRVSAIVMSEFPKRDKYCDSKSWIWSTSPALG